MTHAYTWRHLLQHLDLQCKILIFAFPSARELQSVLQFATFAIIMYLMNLYVSCWSKCLMNVEFRSINIRRHDGKVYVQHAFKILEGKEKNIYIYHTSASCVVCFGRWPPELLFLVSVFNRAARVFPSPLQRDERDHWFSGESSGSMQARLSASRVAFCQETMSWKSANLRPQCYRIVRAAASSQFIPTGLRQSERILRCARHARFYFSFLFFFF